MLATASLPRAMSETQLSQVRVDTPGIPIMECAADMHISCTVVSLAITVRRAGAFLGSTVSISGSLVN